MASEVVRETSPRPWYSRGAGRTSSPAQATGRSRSAGVAARSSAPRASHGSGSPAVGRADPVTILIDQASSRVPEPGAGPQRPHARVPVHLLPWVGRDHGRRPGAHAEHRDQGAAVRRRPPVQLRRLRLAGPALVFDLNDFDETLPGTVGVGRQAADGQPVDRRSRQRVQRSRTSRVVRSAAASYREAMREFADVSQPRGLVLAADRRRHPSDVGRAGRQEDGAGSTASRQGDDQTQRPRHCQAHPARRRHHPLRRAIRP